MKESIHHLPEQPLGKIVVPKRIWFFVFKAPYQNISVKARLLKKSAVFSRNSGPQDLNVTGIIL